MASFPPAAPTGAQPEPRVYRLKRGWRWFLVVGGLTFVLFGLFCMGWGLLEPGAREALGLVLGGGCITGIGAGTFISLREKLLFDGVTLHHRNVLRSRSLSREEILGRRGHSSGLLVVPVKAGTRGLVVGFAFERDALLQAWLEGLPDLDAQDRQHILDATAASLGLAAGSLEARQRLTRARRLAGGLRVLSVCAAGLIFVPQLHVVALLGIGAVPLIAVLLALTGSGLYQSDPRPVDRGCSSRRSGQATQ